MDEPIAIAKVNVHLNTGTIIPTLVYDDEYDNETDDLGDHVAELIKHKPGQAGWAQLGDVFFHQKAVAAIELVEDYDNGQEAT